MLSWGTPRTLGFSWQNSIMNFFWDTLYYTVLNWFNQTEQERKLSKVNVWLQKMWTLEYDEMFTCIQVWHHAQPNWKDKTVPSRSPSLNILASDYLLKVCLKNAALLLIVSPWWCWEYIFLISAPSWSALLSGAWSSSALGPMSTLDRRARMQFRQVPLRYILGRSQRLACCLRRSAQIGNCFLNVGALLEGTL